MASYVQHVHELDPERAERMRRVQQQARQWRWKQFDKAHSYTTYRNGRRVAPFRRKQQLDVGMVLFSILSYLVLVWMGAGYFTGV